jgi:hypothetical protein
MPLYGDIMFIHDPQPAALIQKRKEMGKKLALAVSYRSVQSQSPGLELSA